MSNNQRGTVGLSAGDWIRIKRLQGARNYATTILNDTDVNIPTTNQLPYSPSTLIPKQTGASRIRRTNSQWIDYRAAQTGDYVQNITIGEESGYPRILQPTRICDCTSDSMEGAPTPKYTGCKRCGVYTHKSIQ